MKTALTENISNFKTSFYNNLETELKKEVDEHLLQTVGFQEFNENIEKMYASSIFMSSKNCASWTCD